MVNIAATFLAITEGQLVKYFRDKGAISPATAITLDLTDLKAHLETPDFLSNLESHKFIKKTSDNKYYLDERSYDKNTKFVMSIVIAIFLILLLSVTMSRL